MEDLECQIKTNVSLKLLRQSVGEWEEKVELEGKLGKKRELRTFVKRLVQRSIHKTLR